jgi:hypothetical protein
VSLQSTAENLFSAERKDTGTSSASNHCMKQSFLEPLAPGHRFENRIDSIAIPVAEKTDMVIWAQSESPLNIQGDGVALVATRTIRKRACHANRFAAVSDCLEYRLVTRAQFSTHNKNIRINVAEREVLRHDTCRVANGVISGHVYKSVMLEMTDQVALGGVGPVGWVIPPFLERAKSRGYAAKASFCFGVLPPSAMLGRS